MSHRNQESDWKVFRELRQAALQRFSQRILEGVDRLRQDESRTYHERYTDIYRWVQDRDEEMARAFNNARRSAMLPQLAAILALGLVEPDELAPFTTVTREAVELLSKSMTD